MRSGFSIDAMWLVVWLVLCNPPFWERPLSLRRFESGKMAFFRHPPSPPKLAIRTLPMDFCASECVRSRHSDVQGGGFEDATWVIAPPVTVHVGFFFFFFSSVARLCRSTRRTRKLPGKSSVGGQGTPLSFPFLDPKFCHQVADYSFQCCAGWGLRRYHLGDRSPSCILFFASRASAGQPAVQGNSRVK